MPVPLPPEDLEAARLWPERRPSVAGTAADDRMLQRGVVGGVGWGIVAGVAYAVLLAAVLAVASMDADAMVAVLMIAVPVAGLVGLFAGALVGAVVALAAVAGVRRLPLVAVLATAAVWAPVVVVAAPSLGVNWQYSVLPLVTAMPLAALHGRRLSRAASTSP